MRRALPAFAAVAAVAIAVIRSPAVEVPPIPLVSIEQGVSVHLVAGTGVFVLREGSIVTVFSPATPGGNGDRLVWCPGERFFVSPARKDLFNAAGEFVAGRAPRDMDRHPSRVTEDLQVEVDVTKVVKAKGRSPGEVPGDVGNRYLDWAADPTEPQRFCRRPLRA